MGLEGGKRWVEESEVLLERGSERVTSEKDQKDLVTSEEILLE